MSSLIMADKRWLEELFRTSSGYVLNFSDAAFGAPVFDSTGFDIHDKKYQKEVTSKAKKLRSFWIQESDSTIGKLLNALIHYSGQLGDDGLAK